MSDQHDETTMQHEPVGTTSTISGVQLGLFLTLVGTAFASVMTAGNMFDRAIGPVREDIAEIKQDQRGIRDEIRDLRDRPVPPYVTASLDTMHNELSDLRDRIEHLERQ